MTPYAADLAYLRINAPPEVGSYRTTCPECSHRRAKSQERCLRVHVYHDGIKCYCHHCLWEYPN